MSLFTISNFFNYHYLQFFHFQNANEDIFWNINNFYFSIDSPCDQTFLNFKKYMTKS